jgi:hypothetical protein
MVKYKREELQQYDKTHYQDYSIVIYEPEAYGYGYGR